MLSDLKVGIDSHRYLNQEENEDGTFQITKAALQCNLELLSSQKEINVGGGGGDPMGPGACHQT